MNAVKLAGERPQYLPDVKQSSAADDAIARSGCDATAICHIKLIVCGTACGEGP